MSSTNTTTTTNNAFIALDAECYSHFLKPSPHSMVQTLIMAVNLIWLWLVFMHTHPSLLHWGRNQTTT